MNAVLSLKPSYYEALRRLTLELAGVNLGGDHTFLIETRLRTLARREGYESLSQMVDSLFGEGEARLALQVVSSLLERDTHFNHDPETLLQIEKKLLSEISAVYPDAPIRILSFGCNSGQEAYSIAMMIERSRDKHPGIKFDISGVDYPSSALDRATVGRYTHFEVQRGLPIQDLITFFDRAGEDWVIKPSLREKVSFREHHLLSNLSDLGNFHLIVFRNGLKYYSPAAQIRVLRSLSSHIMPHGYLVLGSEDRLSKFSFGFEALDSMPGIFKKLPAVDHMSEENDTPAALQIQSDRLTMLEKQLQHNRG